MVDLNKLSRIYMGTVLINIVMILIGIQIYSDQFSLAMDPFSWLGKMVTASGMTNTAGFLLFTATIFFNIFRWGKF